MHGLKNILLLTALCLSVPTFAAPGDDFTIEIRGPDEPQQPARQTRRQNRPRQVVDATQPRLRQPQVTVVETPVRNPEPGGSQQGAQNAQPENQPQPEAAPAQPQTVSQTGQPQAAAVAAPAPAPAAPRQTAAQQTPPPAQPAPADSAPESRGQTYTVEPSDTIWSVANRFLPADRAVNEFQIVASLYRNNPRAFLGGNINSLQPGTTIVVPDLSLIARESTDTGSTLLRSGRLSPMPPLKPAQSQQNVQAVTAQKVGENQANESTVQMRANEIPQYTATETRLRELNEQRLEQNSPLNKPKETDTAGQQAQNGSEAQPAEEQQTAAAQNQQSGQDPAGADGGPDGSDAKDGRNARWTVDDAQIVDIRAVRMMLEDTQKNVDAQIKNMERQLIAAIERTKRIAHETQRNSAEEVVSLAKQYDTIITGVQQNVAEIKGTVSKLVQENERLRDMILKNDEKLEDIQMQLVTYNNDSDSSTQKAMMMVVLGFGLLVFIMLMVYLFFRWKNRSRQKSLGDDFEDLDLSSDDKLLTDSLGDVPAPEPEANQPTDPGADSKIRTEKQMNEQQNAEVSDQKAWEDDTSVAKPPEPPAPAEQSAADDWAAALNEQAAAEAAPEKPAAEQSAEDAWAAALNEQAAAEAAPAQAEAEQSAEDAWAAALNEQAAAEAAPAEAAAEQSAEDAWAAALNEQAASQGGQSGEEAAIAEAMKGAASPKNDAPAGKSQVAMTGADDASDLESAAALEQDTPDDLIQAAAADEDQPDPEALMSAPAAEETQELPADDTAPDEMLAEETAEPAAEDIPEAPAEDSGPDEMLAEAADEPAAEDIPEAPAEDSGLDEMLAEAADEPAAEDIPEAPAEDSGLDEMLAEGTEEPAAEDILEAPAEDSGLDEMLAEGTEGPAAEDIPEVPAEDSGLDEMLAEGTEEPAAEDIPEAPAEDSGLDEMLAEETAEPAAEETQEQPDGNLGLDEMLAEGTEEPAAEDIPEAPAEDSGLDEMLAEGTEESAAEDAQEQPDGDLGLDEMLAEGAEEPAAEDAEEQPDGDLGLDEMLAEGTEEPAAEDAQELPDGDLGLDKMLAEGTEEPAAEDAQELPDGESGVDELLPGDMPAEVASGETQDEADLAAVMAEAAPAQEAAEAFEPDAYLPGEDLAVPDGAVPADAEDLALALGGEVPDGEAREETSAGDAGGADEITPDAYDGAAEEVSAETDASEFSESQTAETEDADEALESEAYAAEAEAEPLAEDAEADSLPKADDAAAMSAALAASADEDTENEALMADEFSEDHDAPEAQYAADESYAGEEGDAQQLPDPAEPGDAGGDTEMDGAWPSPETQRLRGEDSVPAAVAAMQSSADDGAVNAEVTDAESDLLEAMKQAGADFEETAGSVTGGVYDEPGDSEAERMQADLSDEDVLSAAMKAPDGVLSGAGEDEMEDEDAASEQYLTVPEDAAQAGLFEGTDAEDDAQIPAADTVQEEWQSGDVTAPADYAAADSQRDEMIGSETGSADSAEADDVQPDASAAGTASDETGEISDLADLLADGTADDDSDDDDEFIDPGVRQAADIQEAVRKGQNIDEILNDDLDLETLLFRQQGDAQPEVPQMAKAAETRSADAAAQPVPQPDEELPEPETLTDNPEVAEDFSAELTEPAEAAADTETETEEAPAAEEISAGDSTPEEGIGEDELQAEVTEPEELPDETPADAGVQTNLLPDGNPEQAEAPEDLSGPDEPMAASVDSGDTQGGALPVQDAAGSADTGDTGQPQSDGRDNFSDNTKIFINRDEPVDSSSLPPDPMRWPVREAARSTGGGYAGSTVNWKVPEQDDYVVADGRATGTATGNAILKMLRRGAGGAEPPAAEASGFMEQPARPAPLTDDQRQYYIDELNLARLYMETGDSDEALRMISRIIGLGDEDLTARSRELLADYEQQ